jgi:hypothetical protein
MTPPLKRKFIVLLAIAAVLLVPLAAQADTTYQLTYYNAALSGYPQPFADVTVNRTGNTTADITFTGLTTGGYTYFMGDGSTFALNVNAASFTVGTITETTPYPSLFTPTLVGPPPPGATPIGSGQVDGFGNFNLTIDNSDGAFSSAQTGSFTLTNNSGTWASDADVLTNISTQYPYLAAAHIFVFTFDAQGNLTSINPEGRPGALTTGFAANGPPSGGLVPVPPTAWLLGSGLLGLLLLGRRRKTL